MVTVLSSMVLQVRYSMTVNFRGDLMLPMEQDREISKDHPFLICVLTGPQKWRKCSKQFLGDWYFKKEQQSLKRRRLWTQVMRMIWRFLMGLKMVYRKQQIFYPIMPHTQASRLIVERQRPWLSRNKRHNTPIPKRARLIHVRVEQVSHFTYLGAGIENVATFKSFVTDCGGSDMWQGCHQNACPKNYCCGSQHTEKDPEADLASHGLTVSRKTTTLLPDATLMSKK